MPRKKIADETAEQPLKPSARKSKKEGAEAAKPRKKRALTVKESPAESPEVGFRFRSADITAEERPAPVERVKRKGDRREARRPRDAAKPQRQRAARAAPADRTKVALPKRPVRDRIPTPEGAPRIIVRNGRPCLVIQGQIVPPFMFFGNPSDEARAATVFEEVRKAASAGVHLHSLMVEFVVSEQGAQDALDLSAYLLDQVLSADPDGKIIFRLVFAGAAGWQKKYPDAAYRYVDGLEAEPSFCDDAFWGEAARLLSGYIEALKQHASASSVIGIHLDRGEWFFAEGWGYDHSMAAEEAFRNWARLRYNGDRVALQSAWFDGSARFETLKVPSYNEEPLSGEGFLRARRKERPWVDYHLFMSDAIVDRIQSLAWHVKKASVGMFLVAVSYGYTFEWSHPASGHLSLGKLLRAPEVDIIAGPPSYRDRELGGTAGFPGPIDSFALNGKLFISEEDFKTPIGRIVEADEFNPLMPTPQALEAAHWRGVGSALAHATGVAWMDLWGNGWLNTSAIWRRAGTVREMLARAIATPLKDPDVAVLIDERSLAYLSDARAFKHLVQTSREAILRAGISAGFYLLTDLAHRKRFPDAKLYIFLNAWDIRPEVRAAIRRLHGNGKTLFWLYSAGLFEAGRPVLERVREVTGIAIRPQPFNSRAGTTILNRKHPLTELLEEKALSTVEQLEPSYFAIPEDGTVILGEYTQTGLPSFAEREIRDGDDGVWQSVFLGEPLLTERLIRGLCHFAGVHVWNYHGDVVHVRPPFLSIHYSGGGHRIATLPDRWHAFDAIAGQKVGSDATHLKSDASEGASQILIVGEETEVAEISSMDADACLEVGDIPVTEDDTLYESILDLAVPAIPPAQAPEYLDLYFDEQPDGEPAPKPAKKAPAKRTSRPPAKNPRKKKEPPPETGLGFSFRDKP